MSDSSDYECDYSEYEYTDDEEIGELAVDDEIDAHLQCNDGDDLKTLSTGGTRIRMVSADGLKSTMNSKVKEVVEVLDAPPSAAAILLRDHGWATERLLPSLFDNPQMVFKKSGVLARCTEKDEKASNLVPAKRMHCMICLDEDGYEDNEMMCMPCGHAFCESCWFGYMINALEKGPLCLLETCPHFGCNELITEEEVRRVAPILLPRFESYQLKSFVETCDMARWCPGPGCEQVALALSDGELSVGGDVAKCGKCETSFCMNCGEEPHSPTACKELAMWKEKCQDESETANWMLSYTKRCPKCSTRIEKNGGCQYMTCAKCRHKFCWICLKESDHKEHACNSFDEKGEYQSDAAKVKRELERYLHYYKRFQGHSLGEDFARKVLKETEEKLIEMVQGNESDTVWTEVKYLKDANEQLVECRRVLKYTYVHAYYLQDDVKKMRFEYHQGMLERFTERLSALTEQPLQEMSRIDIVNQAKATDKFVKNMLEYCRSHLNAF